MFRTPEWGALLALVTLVSMIRTGVARRRPSPRETSQILDSLELGAQLLGVLWGFDLALSDRLGRPGAHLLASVCAAAWVMRSWAWEGLRWRRGPLSPWAAVILGLVLGWPLAMVGAFAQQWLGPPLPMPEVFAQGPSWAWAVAVIFVTPMLEEIYFRGFVYRALALRWTAAEGVVGSAVLFALAHGSSATFGSLTVIGLGLGLLRWGSRGLLVPMVAHGVNNAFAYFQIHFQMF